MTDHRIDAVESNLLAFFTAASDSPVLRRDPVDDVLAVHSDVPFPMFNAVVGAHFGDDAAVRTAEVVDSYLDAGLPWLWWLTPSTTSAELEAVLDAHGLEREDVPGMYADLAVLPPTAPVPGLTIDWTEDTGAFIDLMLAGFGIPGEVREPMARVVEHLPETINLIAHLDGTPVACGSAYPTGATAGLYNIATLEEGRGRGIGYAVTVALMEVAREGGAGHAILHASTDGRPVYARAGFVEVCEVPQYVWMPPENRPT